MSDRLHVAFFTNTYHPVISGVVRSISTFRQSLTELGHNVFIFAQYSSDYADSEPFIFRYPAIELPMANDAPIAFPISAFIDRVFPILKPDVVHSHHPALVGQAAVRKAEEDQLPLIFTHHTRYQEYSHYVGLPQDLVKKAIERLVGDYMAHCQHVIVPSDSIRELLQDEYGIREGVTVLPTGIDPAPFRAVDRSQLRRRHRWEDKRIMVSIGRLGIEKNWDTLFAAAALAMQDRPDLRLVLLGDGDERKHLVRLAQDLGIAGQVELVGMVPFAQVPGYLVAADLFCFASLSETQGLVTLEAMAAGLPVVAVAASGTSDVVEDGVDGLLTENDSRALAAAIGRVLDQPGLGVDLCRAAQQKVESFAIQTQARKLVQLYRQAIVDKRANRFVHVDKRKPIFAVDWPDWMGIGGGDETTPRQQR